ncbi:hypothetical protein EGW08_011752, partial [Elysia chlorotica]
ASVQVKPEPYHAPENTQEKAQPAPPCTAPRPPPSKPVQKPDNETTQGKEEEKKDEDPIDSESAKGIFGWETVDNTSIPYILRRGKKFVSVRIVDRKLLSKYPNTFPDELGKKDPLVSHFITEAESKLLNEINTDHCDFEYGQNPFTTKDLIVDLDEFSDFFKLVKKTFPAEVLAKMGGEVVSTISSPVKSDLSQFCGWIQINNTVSPYILRVDGGKQVRLVPLSVIVYAAGLLNNAGIEGLLPTPQECAMLNEACKIAGFDFSFGKNTRLISMAEVLQRCQVQLFDLPFKNPLQHARYIDPRTGHPSSNLLMTQAPQSQSSLKPPQSASPHTQIPFSHSNSQDMSGQLDSNPFMSQLARHPAYPSHLMLPSAVSAAQVSQAAAAAMFSPAGPLASLGIDALRHMGPRPLPPENKMLDVNAIPPRGIPPSMWNMMPRPPPPAHANNNHPSVIPKTPPVTPDPPSSMFPGQSVPQNNIYQGKNPSTVPDLAHPIFRGPMGMPPRVPAGPPMQRDNFGPMVSGESPKANNGVNNRTKRQAQDVPTPQAHSAGGNNNLHKSDLKQRILACLVNGKSISCLHIDTPSRRGRFCLVEAVSKLYFPAVPLQEFVKVLQAILKINLLECTPEEEAAFVQYYNLPVSKLKCNKIIAVDDLDKFFPQLNYMFTK